MAKTILNFHFDYLNPFLSAQVWLHQSISWSLVALAIFIYFFLFGPCSKEINNQKDCWHLEQDDTKTQSSGLKVYTGSHLKTFPIFREYHTSFSVYSQSYKKYSSSGRAIYPR